MDSFEDTWKIVCDFCRSRMTEVAYNTWFDKLTPYELDFTEGVAIIEAPNAFHANIVAKVGADLLKEAFDNIFYGSIQYKIMTSEEIHDLEVKRGKVSSAEEDEQQNAVPEIEEMTFSNFIVGQTNQLAHAACLSVATKPATLYNPLFIWGNSGLGKTHLLNATMYELNKNFDNLNIVYVSGEQFTNELVTAIQKGTTNAFREKYRKVDVLLVDDIQFIGGRESTQEEFFHTFNELYNSRKQIILASDRPPKDIAYLDDRLRSRFIAGLITDIQPPDFETRVAIINRKAQTLGLTIPPSVCEFIASKLKSNIRQLEGAVKNLNAYHSMDGKTPSISTANLAINQMLNDSEENEKSVDQIIAEVARTYNVSVEDIKSSRRQARISLARQVSMYVIREIKQLSMESIGEAFGGRDHSTVVYAIQVVEEKMRKDPSTKKTVSDIIKDVRSK